MNPIVVVMVGTDHHPFDRLVDWVDSAAVRLPHVRFVVQHGASRVPVVAEGRAFMSRDELTAIIGEAIGFICHGGPGTIMDGRAAGHVPICVPRDPSLGEHVDGHQLRFSSLVSDIGIVRRVTAEKEFSAVLDDVLASEVARKRTALGPSEVTERARELLGRELDVLMQRPLRRRILSRAGR